MSLNCHYSKNNSENIDPEIVFDIDFSQPSIPIIQMSNLTNIFDFCDLFPNVLSSFDADGDSMSILNLVAPADLEKQMTQPNTTAASLFLADHDFAGTKRRRQGDTIELDDFPPNSKREASGEYDLSPRASGSSNSLLFNSTVQQQQMYDPEAGNTPGRKRSSFNTSDSGVSTSVSPRHSPPLLPTLQELEREVLGVRNVSPSLSSSNITNTAVDNNAKPKQRKRNGTISVSTGSSGSRESTESVVVVERSPLIITATSPRRGSPLSSNEEQKPTKRSTRRDAPNTSRRDTPSQSIAPPKPKRKSPLRVSSTETPILLKDPVLVMKEQPNQFARFRYEAEGRQSYLDGTADKSWPTVAVNPVFSHLIPNGTLVEVSLVTRYDDEEGNPVPHWHKLTTKSGGPVPAQKFVNFQAAFPQMIIQRRKSDTKRTPEDHRAVRLMFTARFQKDGVLHIARVCSQPIFNTELKVELISPCAGPSNFRQQIVILCSKIQKKSIAVRISDRPTNLCPPSGAWHQEHELGNVPNNVFMIRSVELKTHHQFAVIFEIPPCPVIPPLAPRHVLVQLVDENDGTSSNHCVYSYYPAQPAALAPLMLDPALNHLTVTNSMPSSSSSSPPPTLAYPPE